MLLERTELTAGSTWHAAGLLPLFNMSYTVGQLHKYSVELYKRLPEETGQDVSFHVTGNLRLATTRDRLDEYHKYCGTANTIGVPFEIISPARVKELWPLVNLGDGVDTPKIIGALYHPHDGHIAPVDLTMALRKGARAGGAEICEQTAALSVERTPSGEWKIRTTQGDIVCEHVVCATGNYARETGRMFGLNVPAIPVEHQYIVYDESAELNAYRKGGGRELAVLRESDASYYLREERMGWILGPYERGGAGALRRRRSGVVRQGALRRRPRPTAAARRGGNEARAMPRALRHQDHRQRSHLLHTGRQPADRSGLERRQRLAERGSQLRRHCRRRRRLAARRMDHRGRPRHRHAGRRPASLRRLRRQALHGDARTRRRIATSSPSTTPTRNAPTHGRRRRVAVYGKLDQMGAVWGQRYGWERANWFAPASVPRRDEWSFRRTNYFEHVGNECRRMREKVGVIDLTPFTKHEVTGTGSAAWLDHLVANRVPTRVGRIALCHALTKKGGIRSEFTVTKLGVDRFYLVSAGAGERHDSDYLFKMLPQDGSVRLRNTTTSRGTFVVAGPRSRDVLARLTDTPLDNDHFPWLTGQVIEVGLAVDVHALRVNFVGELGWELHFPIEYANGLFDALFAAGEEFDIGMVGMRAMESLRIEKSYRMWGSDLTRDYTPFEAGLDRFVRMDKGDFIGKKALARQGAGAVPHRFVTLEVHGVTDADPLGNEPLYVRDALVGRATAGCYGHVVGKSLALAYVKPAFAAVGSQMEIEILGERKRRASWASRRSIRKIADCAHERRRAVPRPYRLPASNLPTATEGTMRDIPQLLAGFASRSVRFLLLLPLLSTLMTFGAIAAELEVFHADSLAGPMRELKGAFQAKHPGVALNLTSGVSRQLAERILKGDVCDVYAPSSPAVIDEDLMNKPMGSGKEAASWYVVFSANEMVVITAKGNPLDIRRVSDLREPGSATSA